MKHNNIKKPLTLTVLQFTSNFEAVYWFTLSSIWLKVLITYILYYNSSYVRVFYIVRYPPCEICCLWCAGVAIL